MTLVLAFVAAAGLQLALQSIYLWPLLSACQPLSLVVVGGARRRAAAQVGWLGLAAGLAGDLLAARPVGPGAIAGAVAGIVVATLTARLELEGPLFWTGGALVVTTIGEALSGLIVMSLGAARDHGWLGSLAVIATTTVAAALVALAELGVRAWTSPERKRRRVLRRL